MTDLVPLVPRRPVPALSVSLAGGGTWTLSQQSPQHFTLLNIIPRDYPARGQVVDLAAAAARPAAE